MRPLCLQMTAFGPYVEQQTIDFSALEGRTLFLITGPTGAGKTTLFDAIAYALYGESSGRERDGEALRSDFAPPELLTEVVFDFSLHGRTYQVKRSPKQLRPKLRGAGMAEQAAEACLAFTDEPQRLPIVGIREVNERIVELLGLKYEQFRQIMMIPQGEFRELLVADSKEREGILQKLFGTEFCAALQAELQQRESEWKKTADTEQTIQEQYEIQLAEAMEMPLPAGGTDACLRVAAEWQTEQKQHQAQLTERLRQVKTAISGQQALCAKVKDDNAQLLSLQQVEKGMQDLAALKPAIAEKKDALTRTEAAAALLPQEEEGKSLRREQIRKGEERQQAAQMAAKASAEATAAASEFSALEAKEPEREALRQEIARLEALQPRMTQGEALRRELAEEERLLLKARRELEAQQRQSGQLTEKMKAAEQMLKDKVVWQQQRQALQLTTMRLNDYRDKLTEVETIRRQLGAVEAQESALQQRGTLAKGKRETAEKELEALNAAYFSQSAAALASQLVEGEACPVCGSVHHPAPASASSAADDVDAAVRLRQETKVKELRESETVVFQELAALKARLQAGREHLAGAEAALQKSGGQLEAAPTDATQARQLLQELECQAMTLDAKIDECVRAEALLTTLEKQKATLDQDEKNMQAEITKLATLVPEKQRLLQELESQLPPDVRSSAVLLSTIEERKHLLAVELRRLAEVQRRHTQLHTEAVRLETMVKESDKALADLDRQLRDATERFCHSYRQHGFVDLPTYRQARELVPLLEQMKQAVLQFENDWQKQEALLEDNRKKTAGLTWQDETALNEQLALLTEQERQLQDEHGRLAYRREAVKTALAKATDHKKVLADCRAAFELASDLSKVSRGMGANARKISFERYVLAAYFEEVLQAANGRLRQMTNGRYEMHRRREQNKGNAQSGLDIDVLDNYTGRERPAKTLSGGESFKASLALALGLADVVQAHAGGVSLDTMFIDEGFGTLDPESLDGAIRCLVDLQRSGRLVGIISHVPELKETIDAWLLVDSARSGSRANFCIK